MPAVLALLDLTELVAAARDGSEQAFASLHAHFERLVHGVLLSRVPVQQVDDLAQDTFLHAWRHLSALREPRQFGSWVAMIARNLATDYHRRSRRVTPIADHHRTRDPIDPVAFEALQSIRNLPEAYRETLLLRLVEGMTGPEIAEQTGMTPDSVRVNLHRGMKMLRERLNGRTSR